MSGAYLLLMWDIIQRLPKNGSNLRRKLMSPENKTLRAWLPKEDKKLAGKIPHKKALLRDSAHLKYCSLWGKDGIDLAMSDIA